ncbi:Eco57I restriction-modification methylase domain-containing protein, partial [Heyndrickxia sporothermodurans]
VREILRSNIYGVDINAASVEIARLALWLHTARGDKPLSSLDATVREGNSLIGPDFYKGQVNLYGEEERERINAFDWAAAFPDVMARGGFDAVVGNPPYVKLQNFRTVHADMASYLVHGPLGLDERPYQSTRTGNFDLYLPFIEKGLALLNEEGRLGFIAPSVWTVNEYGEGLRNLVSRGQHLDRWLDFKSFQVFAEATTYTALQFFSKSPRAGICVSEAPAGVVPPNPFADAGRTLAYGRQLFGDRWLLLAGEERDLIDRLYAACLPLASPAYTTHIFQGLITSADAVYHLRRIGPGRYQCSPGGDPKLAPYEVEIEDALMKPLVSGADAKRYVDPATITYLLFPYRRALGNVELIDENTMIDEFPNAWSYLNTYRDTLRFREARRDRAGVIIEAPFDDARWYRFGRHQNLDKQDMAKLVVPRLVAHMGCLVDAQGTSYLDNVDVGGIALVDGVSPWFLAGILNAPVADFMFRRISKPFRGNYLS